VTGPESRLPVGVATITSGANRLRKSANALERAAIRYSANLNDLQRKHVATDLMIASLIAQRTANLIMGRADEDDGGGT